MSGGSSGMSGGSSGMSGGSSGMSGGSSGMSGGSSGMSGGSSGMSGGSSGMSGGSSGMSGGSSGMSGGSSGMSGGSSGMSGGSSGMSGGSSGMSGGSSGSSGGSSGMSGGSSGMSGGSSGSSGGSSGGSGGSVTTFSGSGGGGGNGVLGTDFGPAFEENPQKPPTREVDRDVLAVEALERLGLVMRPLGSADLLSGSDTARIYNDSPRSRSIAAAVTPTRLRRDAVLNAASRYDALFTPVLMTTEPALSVDDPAYLQEREARRREVRLALGIAWNTYMEEAEYPNAVGFVDFIADESAMHSEACSSIKDLREVFAYLQTSGLTPAEIGVCADSILRPITPHNMGTTELRRIMGIGPFVG